MRYLLCSSVALLLCTGAAAENLIPNASFELGLRHGWTMGGKIAVEGKGGVGQVLMYEPPIDTTQSKDGSSSLKLSLFRSNDRYRLGLKRPLIRLEPGQPHVLSMYVKSDARDPSIEFEIFDGSGSRPLPLFTWKFKITNEWKRAQLRFTPPGNEGYDPGELPLQPGGFLAHTRGRAAPDQYAIRVYCYGEGPGTAWLDAVQLEQAQEATPFATKDEIEVGLMIDEGDARYGNIFIAGAPQKIKLVVYNSSAEARAERLDIRIVDIDERVVWEKTVESGPAAGRTHTQVLNPGLARTGTFRAEVRHAGEDELLEELVFSVLRPIRDDITASEGSLGSRAYMPGAEADEWMLKMFRRLGIRWIRALAQLPFDWRAVQPREERWEWYDDNIRRIKEYGLDILPCIRLRGDSVPDWAHTDMPEYTLPVRDAQVAAYVEAMVGRYKKDIRRWEILNEPDSVDPIRALHMLKLCRAAARRADPQALILGSCANKAQFVEPWLRGGGLKLIDDAYSFHYSGSGVNDAEIIELCDRAMDYATRDGKQRALWNTEENGRCSSYPFYRRFHDSLGGGNRKVFVVPRRAASFYARMYVLNRARGVEKILIWCYYYTATYGPPKTLQDRPFEYDGALGPRGAAISIAVNLLDGFQPVGSKLVSPGFTAWLFERQGDTIAALWSPARVEEHSVPMNRPAKVEILDMMGNPIEGEVIAVGEAPVYLVGKGMSPKQVKRVLGDLSSVGR